MIDVISPIVDECLYEICECGDYRHQHVDGTGRCKLNELCFPAHCQAFCAQTRPRGADTLSGR
jgi:hypothetical protein